jgi:hypothetical protein
MPADYSEAALPEYFIVKREILWDFYKVIEYISKYHKAKINRRNDTASLTMFKEHLLSLWWKVRVKMFAFKKYKDNPILLSFDKKIQKVSNLKVEECLEVFAIVEDFLENDLKITKIERQVPNPNRAFIEE